MNRQLPRIVRALLALSCTAMPSAAQELRDVIGTVLTAGDSVPIPGVRVLAPTIGLTAVTGDGGTFQLRGVPRSRLVITFDRLGVRSDTVWLSPGVDVLTVYLLTAAVELAPVVTRARPAARERFEELV